MQLKMTEFHPSLVKQMLQEENQFLSEMFSRMPLPAGELEEQEEEEGEDNQKYKKDKSIYANGNGKRAVTAEELHKKFNELKGVKKLSYKQKQLKKGLKTRMKKKMKREERIMQKRIVKAERNAAGVTPHDVEKVEIAPKVPRVKPVFNSEGHMVFSKFDFSDIGNKKKTQKTEGDPKKILQQLKEKKEKLKELVTAGEKEKALAIQERDAWKSALAKAGGEKVKDDPELLKRTVKRDEQQKKRSTKKWEARISGVEKAQQEKQSKRTENIMKHKKERKINKMKKSSKKGRIIPGF
ncbi:surfeit locus protein 6 homolog [Fopius arisanus]|uniref:Surfeit locus protein 6 homolog n=1 Tax=Fopius arisanus TaxID=64838 RepID=A0A9R1SYQ5_9HYME|nr:PREDICTED: surfeit locus protein 6 homolog [Fopius arisanus]